MMALRKNVNRVNMTHLEGFDKGFRVEIVADGATFQRGMEIQMDLAKSMMGRFHDRKEAQLNTRSNIGQI